MHEREAERGRAELVDRLQRVHDVHVQVHEDGAVLVAHAVQGQGGRGAHAQPPRRGCGQREAEVAQRPLLARVQLAEPDEGHVLRPHRGRRPARGDDVFRAAAQGQREGHAREEARGRGLGRVEVRVGVEVDEADGRAQRLPRARHRPHHERAVPAQHDHEALAERPPHLVGGGAGRAGHDLAVARGPRVVAVGEERQVGEVDHGRAQLAQGRQQTRLAQREGRALRPRLRRSRRAGHADDRDLAAGHESSIVLGRTPPRT